MAIYLEPCKDTLVHFACPTCNNPVDVLTAKAIACNREIVCNTCCTHSLDDDYECDNDDCACNNPYDIVTAAVILRPHAKTLMDNPKSILDTTWYHVTDTPPEMMVFDGTYNMHVGQRETVQAMQEIKYQEESVYVYALRLKDNATIHGTFVDDKSSWCEYGERLTNNEVSGFAYINRWEAPGSVSLFTRCDSVELVHVARTSVIPRRETYADYQFIY